MTKLWEQSAYISLVLCIVGNVAVGYLYLFAQTAYLIANGINLTRDFALNYSMADKVRDSAFLAITIGLIIVRRVVTM